MSFLETVRITNSNGVFCSFTKFYCFNIQRGFSRPKKEVWLGNSHKIHSQMPSLQKTNNSFANLFYCRDIYARILKQKNFDNELLANSQDHELNRDVQLINKIRLFQYSEEIFSAQKRGVASKLIQNTQLIILFQTIL